MIDKQFKLLLEDLTYSGFTQKDSYIEDVELEHSMNIETWSNGKVKVIFVYFTDLQGKVKEFHIKEIGII